MRRLVAVFENSHGKRHRWSMDEPVYNKTPEEIKAALEKFTTLNLFEKGKIKLFQKVVSAKYVETFETPIFDEFDQGVTEKSAQFQTDRVSAFKIEKNSTIEVSKKGLTIRIADDSLDGIKQMELDFPTGEDIFMMSEAAITAAVTEILPDETALADIYYDEVTEPANLHLIKEDFEQEIAESKELKEKPKVNKESPEAGKYRRKKRINHKLLERFNKYKP